jgi:hypothetical protein
VIIFIIVGSIARQSRQQAQVDPRGRRGTRGPIILPLPGSWGQSGSWGDSGGASLVGAAFPVVLAAPLAPRTPGGLGGVGRTGTASKLVTLVRVVADLTDAVERDRDAGRHSSRCGAADDASIPFAGANVVAASEIHAEIESLVQCLERITK